MAIPPSTIFANLETLNNFVNTTSNVDVVGIFDGTTLQQVFTEARPVKADIRETSLVMNHPTETGTVLSDHHIINPIEINILLFIKSEFYNSVYTQIKKAFVAADKLSVQMRTGVYPNMIISAMPHIEDPDYYDAITMPLFLREVLYVVPNSVSAQPAPVNYAPADPVNQNTVQIGQRHPELLSLGGAIIFKALGRF